MKIFLFLFLFLPHLSWASGSSRAQQADSLISTNGTKTYSLPAATDTLTGRASTDTLTNKSISGSTNTLTNISLTTSVTGALPVANGGTSAATLTLNNVILGNGTSAVQFVAPGTSGNVLTSNGTTWASAAASSGTWVQEDVTGCNSTATAFTLAFTPSSSGVVSLYLDGTIQRQGSGKDYTISGASITLSIACSTGQLLYAVYTH
jgi:hypothetical protein